MIPFIIIFHYVKEIYDIVSVWKESGCVDFFANVCILWKLILKASYYLIPQKQSILHDENLRENPSAHIIEIYYLEEGIL